MGINYSEGTYSCLVKEQSMAVSKNGNDMLVFRCHPHAVVVKNDAGEESLDSSIMEEADCWARLTILPDNEQSLEYTMKKLRHAGFTGSSFSELEFVGKQILLTCKHNGEYEQWEFPLPALEQREPSTMDAKDQRKLDALFGKYLKDGSKKPAAKPRQTVPATSNDEVPF